MGYEDFEPGRVFVVPLLQGGYAFGYLTFFDKGLMGLGNIFDYVGDDPKPPPDITEKPVLLHDHIIGSEFLLTPKHKAGERWKFLNIYMKGQVAPQNRYYRMGGPPRSFRRIDILKEEPDVPLSPEESTKYPTVSMPFPPTPTAKIEVAVKHLLMSPQDLVKGWREKKPQRSRP
jgi:hypothetical protein